MGLQCSCLLAICKSTQFFVYLTTLYAFTYVFKHWLTFMNITSETKSVSAGQCCEYNCYDILKMNNTPVYMFKSSPIFKWRNWLHQIIVFNHVKAGRNWQSPRRYTWQRLQIEDNSSRFYWHGLTLIPAWISNHTPSKVRDEITYPFLNFDDCTVEV